MEVISIKLPLCRSFSQSCRGKERKSINNLISLEMQIYLRNDQFFFFFIVEPWKERLMGMSLITISSMTRLPSFRVLLVCFSLPRWCSCFVSFCPPLSNSDSHSTKDLEYCHTPCVVCFLCKAHIERERRTRHALHVVATGLETVINDDCIRCVIIIPLKLRCAATSATQLS